MGRSRGGEQVTPRCGVCGDHYGDFIVKHADICEDDRKAPSVRYAPEVDDLVREIEEEGEVCLGCSQSYPPNGILFCDDCGMDKDIEQQREREGEGNE